MLQFYFLGANIRKFFELCTVLVHEFFNYSLFLKIKGPVLLIISDHRNHGVGSPDHIQESDISMLYYLSHSPFI